MTMAADMQVKTCVKKCMAIVVIEGTVGLDQCTGNVHKHRLHERVEDSRKISECMMNLRGKAG